MVVNEADIKILKFLNRMARYYGKWVIHDKYPMDLEDPKKVLVTFGSNYIRNFLVNNEFPNYKEDIYDIFITACAMLWLNKGLKEAVVELYLWHRKEKATEEDINEFREILKNER